MYAYREKRPLFCIQTFSGNLNQIKRNRKSGLETTRKRRCLRWPTCVWLRSGVAVSSTSMTLSISSGVENVATRFCQLLVLTLSWLFQASTSLVCLYGQYTNTVKMMMMIKRLFVFNVDNVVPVIFFFFFLAKIRLQSRKSGSLNVFTVYFWLFACFWVKKNPNQPLLSS